MAGRAGGAQPITRGLPARVSGVSQEHFHEWTSKLGAGATIELSADQTGVVTATDTQIEFDNAVEDTHGFFVASLNSLRIPEGMDGTYIVSAQARLSTLTAGNRVRLRVVPLIFSGLVPNYIRSTEITAPVADTRIAIGGLRWVLREGDLIGGWVFHDKGSNAQIEGGATDCTYLQITRVGDIGHDQR